MGELAIVGLMRGLLDFSTHLKKSLHGLDLEATNLKN